MKGMKPDLLLPFMGLSFSLLLHSDLYGQAKEYTPQQPMSADAIPKADVITQVLPDRRVIFRLKAPDAQAVSVLVHQVRDWFSGAAAYFGWMREAKRENTRCGLRPMSDKAASQKTRSPEGCDENGPAAALLLSHVSIQICSFVAPCRRPILIATPLNQSRTWCTSLIPRASSSSLQCEVDQAGRRTGC